MAYTSPTVLTGIGYEKVTVSSAAVGFTATNYWPSGARIAANYVILKCETNGIRITWHGTDPTASSGFPVDAGETLILSVDPSKIKMIRKASDSAVSASFNRI